MNEEKLTHKNCIKGAQDAGFFCVLLGVVVLIGWARDFAILRTFLPGMEAMKPNSAIGFILCGFSLICLSSSQPKRLFEWVGSIFATFVSVIGGLTLIQYITDQNFGIDRFMFTEIVPEGTNQRMAPLTAICFFMSGFALIFIHAKNKTENMIRHASTMTVFFISLFVIIGYLYNVNEFYTSNEFSAMAIHAGIGFIILVLGLVLARPDSDPVALLINTSPTGKLVLRMMPVVLLLPFLTGKLRLMGEQAGWYDPTFGVALNALATIFILTGFVWWNARILLRAEENIKDTQARMTAAIETSLDGVIITDEDNVIIEWSPQAEAIFGWNAADAIGQKFSGMITSDTDIFSHHKDIIQTTDNDDRSYLKKRVEVTAQHRDGHTFPAELTITPHKFGDSYNFVAFIRDISERKANEELLRLAKQQAESANQAKSDFLASMSHEIRTPMNVVVGISNILSRDNIPAEKRKEMLNSLKLSSQALLNLIDDVLDLSKIESQKIELEYVPFRLDELVNEIIEINQVKAREKNISLTAEISSIENNRYIGDPLRIRQILMNLVSNAIKFTPQGRVMLYAEATASQDDGYTDIRINIRDTGIGISKDKLDKIFDKFTQADSYSTRKYGGSGLGLTISRDLAELMGGTLSAKSEKGKGSEFTLHITMAKGDDISDQDYTAISHHKKPRHASSLNVLITESDDASMIVTSHLLSEINHHFTCVKKSAECIEKLKTDHENFDVVLMELQLPDMDGIEATKRIRQIEKKNKLEQIPIIGMTSNPNIQDRDKCIEAGMQYYLSKPFTLEQLRFSLDKVTN